MRTGTLKHFFLALTRMLLFKHSMSCVQSSKVSTPRFQRITLKKKEKKRVFWCWWYFNGCYLCHRHRIYGNWTWQNAILCIMILILVPSFWSLININQPRAYLYQIVTWVFNHCRRIIIRGFKVFWRDLFLYLTSSFFFLRFSFTFLFFSLVWNVAWGPFLSFLKKKVGSIFQMQHKYPYLKPTFKHFSFSNSFPSLCLFCRFFFSLSLFLSFFLLLSHCFLRFSVFFFTSLFFLFLPNGFFRLSLLSFSLLLSHCFLRLFPSLFCLFFLLHSFFISS